MSEYRPYNPLDRINLGNSVKEALLKQSIHPLPPASRFVGAGIYALYYTGTLAMYQPLAEENRNGQFTAPIYVGEAVPEGARKGDIRGNALTYKLFERLRHHAMSIDQAENLRVEEFFCRFLTVEDIWIPLGESMMIAEFKPVWNKVIDGFGIKTPGARRKNQKRSTWDTLHPGRRFVTRLELPPNDKSVERLEEEIRAFFELPEEAREEMPTVDTGLDDLPEGSAED